MTMLMNPYTGSVDTYNNWRSEYEAMSAEEWGGSRFEDACLIEVVRNQYGDWVEA